MPVLVGFQAFRPASSFVSWDRDALRNPARFIPATVSNKPKKMHCESVGLIFKVL